MGNNTSALPNNVRRKSSVSKKREGKPGGAKASHEEHSISQQQSLAIPSNTQNGYPLPFKPKAVVSPNVFYDNLTDHDYFGKINSSEGSKESKTDKSSAEVLSASFDDDDDDNIDEDLINKNAKELNQRESDEYKRVLVKYVNYDSTTRADAHPSAGHFEEVGEVEEEEQVYLIGSFNDWSKKIRLQKDDDGIHKVLIDLPFGIYKVKFLVNNDVKYSEDLPIATDKSGNVVNWFEVDDLEGVPENRGDQQNIFEAGIIEQDKIISNKRKSSTSFLHNGHHSNSQFSLGLPQEDKTYSQEIPEMFHQSDEILPVDEEFLHRNPIPELPIYLNNNVLNNHFNKHHNSNLQDVQLKNKNKMISSGLNSHIIPHVNLNHLLTSNIKNNVLSVACTTRYSGKFITQIMYSPSE